MALSRYHATAFLGLPAGHPVEELRRRWDPEMARQIPAHVTLIYPEEIPDPEALIDRTRAAAPSIPSLRMILGLCFYHGSPDQGVFLGVTDADGDLARFRAAALPGGSAIDFPAHVTVVHPRTSGRGARAWAELTGTRIEAEVTVTEVAITAFDGDRWATVGTCGLG